MNIFTEWIFFNRIKFFDRGYKYLFWIHDFNWKKKKKIFTEKNKIFIKIIHIFFLKIYFFKWFCYIWTTINDSPSKTEKSFLFHLKSSFRSRDIQIFVFFPHPFHFFQIQKDKWKWDNSWFHGLACINFQV